MTTETALPEGVQAILMPAAGNTMEEGTIVSWLVKPGDQINVGDIVAEIETDKATMELEAEAGGRVAKLLLDEGDSIEVKKPIILLAEDDALIAGFGEEAPAAAPAPAPTPAPAAAATPAPSTNGSTNGSANSSTNGSAGGAPVAAANPGGRTSVDTLPSGVRVSPAARKLAQERGLIFEAKHAPEGSGPGGRIMTRDVERLAVTTAATAPAAASVTPAAASASMPASMPVVAGEGATRIPLTKMRKAIGLNLQRSMQTVPHFYSKLTIDAEPLMAFRAQLKPTVPASINDYIVKACSKILMELPAFRQQLDEAAGEMVQQANANIGIAVGLDEGEGLVVPVLMNTEAMGLGQIASGTKQLVADARNGKLANADKGVFTISNLGMFGIDEFTAIINPPQAAILAVSAIRDDVVVVDGMMRPGKRMTVTLSADHRVIDGMMSARFLARLKELLENPGDLV